MHSSHRPTESAQPAPRRGAFPWDDAFSGFQTTHWSAIRAASSGDADRAPDALESICQSYWYPLYAFIRRFGHSTDDARDLTQEFFARCLNRNTFARADASRGRFRTFLLASVKHFLHEEWRKGQRAKRGGGECLVPLDTEAAEQRLAQEPAASTAPDLAFDRRWAETLLQRTLNRLQQDYSRTGRATVYQGLQHLLWGHEKEQTYAEMGARLGLNPGTVKVAVLRLKRRFRDLLREEVRASVAREADVDGELRHLLGVLGS